MCARGVHLLGSPVNVFPYVHPEPFTWRMIVSTGLFLVTRSHGPGWNTVRTLEEQELWREHAEFMQAMVSDGFVMLGGPILDTPDALLVVKAARTLDVERRLAMDPWTLSGHLCLTSVRPWQLRLGALAATG